MHAHCAAYPQVRESQVSINGTVNSPSQAQGTIRPRGDTTECSMRLGDPHQCRQQAAYCIQRAALSNSPLARENLANMAETWIKLAIQLEEQLQRAFELLSETE